MSRELNRVDHKELLSDVAERKSLLQDANDSEDGEILLRALYLLTENEGFDKVSEEIGFSVEDIKKSFSPADQKSFNTMIAALRSAGIEFSYKA